MQKLLCGFHGGRMEEIPRKNSLKFGADRRIFISGDSWVLAEVSLYKSILVLSIISVKKKVSIRIKRNE